MPQDPRQPEFDDHTLMQRLVARDPAALSLIYDRYSGLVFTISRRVLRDDQEAEQVLVDVFFELWQRPGQFDPTRASASTYLMMLSRSRAIDHLRRRRATAGRETTAADPNDPMPDPQDQGPVGAMLQDERAQQVRRALGELSESERNVIELAFYEGLSHGQISKKLDTPLGTIKTWIRRGLQKMRRHVTAIYTDEEAQPGSR